MSFRLPPQDHSARELCGDMATLAITLDPANAAKLPNIRQARVSAETMFANQRGVKRVAIIIIRADSDQRWLVTFGPRGGWRKEWNFGTGRD